MIITIDGYSCTGKSTIAKLLAQKLKYKQVNSGLIYRYFGYALLQNEITMLDFNRKSSTIKSIILDLKINLPDLEKNIETLKKKKVSEIGKLIAKEQYARNIVDSYIQSVSCNNNIVVEGRDIGVTVFPNADYKFFFIANDQVRANRLCKQRKSDNLAETLREIKERDNDDETRANSPLKKAIDAIEIDTSNKNENEILNDILDVIKK